MILLTASVNEDPIAVELRAFPFEFQRNTVLRRSHVRTVTYGCLQTIACT